MPPKLPTLLPRVTPKTEHPKAARPSDGSSHTELPRKRQAVKTACDSCRKRKTRCDGGRPRCAPCVQADRECEFASGASLSDASEQVTKYQSVVELLHRASPNEAFQALQRIRDATDVRETVDSLAETQLPLPEPVAGAGSTATVHATAGQGLRGRSLRPGHGRLQSPHDNFDYMFEKHCLADARDIYVEKDVFVDISMPRLPLSRWTSVSDNDQLMNHLLSMFFTWDSVVERAIYRPVFEEDVNEADPQVSDLPPRIFCSHFLVNALLAAGCLFTRNPGTFTRAEDGTSRGRVWADEAERLLETDSEPSLPLLQGLYALFVYEGNIGNGSKSLRYLFKAMEVYKALNDDEDEPVTWLQRRHGVHEARFHREQQAISWCMWGFYCSECRKPRVGKAWHEDDFPLSLPDAAGYWWFPYPISLKVQRSLRVEIREADLQLSELAEEILDFLYSKDGENTPLAQPERASKLYSAVVRWKFSCPDGVKFEEAVLPHAILLHIAAEVLLITLLRPFSQMTHEQFGTFVPLARCHAHTNALMTAVWAFRAFSQLRFEYWLTHVLGTAAFIAMDELSDAPVQVDILIRSCHCLHEMRVMLPLATDVLSGVRAAFKRHGSRLPEYLERYFVSVSHRDDGLMHYAVTSVLPSPADTASPRKGAGLQLQELLDEFGDLEID